MEVNATVNFTSSDIEAMLETDNETFDDGRQEKVFEWTITGTKGEIINLTITVGDDN